MIGYRHNLYHVLLNYYNISKIIIQFGKKHHGSSLYLRKFTIIIYSLMWKLFFWRKLQLQISPLDMSRLRTWIYLLIFWIQLLFYTILAHHTTTGFYKSKWQYVIWNHYFIVMLCYLRLTQYDRMHFYIFCYFRTTICMLTIFHSIFVIQP